MIQRKVLITLLAVAVPAPVMTLAGDTIETIEKDLIAKWEQHTSLSASFTLEQNIDMEVMKINGKGTGTFEYLKKGDKSFTRMDMHNKTVQTMRTEETTTEKTISLFDDGEIAYQLVDADGTKAVVKSKSAGSQMGGGAVLFRQLHELNTLKLLPDEILDGQAVYVFEATPKTAGNAYVSKNVYYFQKDTGFMLKYVSLSDTGTPTATMIMSDVKINPRIDPARFVFKAPEGVSVMDLTGS